MKSIQFIALFFIAVLFTSCEAIYVNYYHVENMTEGPIYVMIAEGSEGNWINLDTLIVQASEIEELFSDNFLLQDDQDPDYQLKGSSCIVEIQDASGVVYNKDPRDLSRWHTSVKDNDDADLTLAVFSEDFQ